MKIRELLEQTISPVPPGQSGPLPPTTPTEPGPSTSNTPKDPNAPANTQGPQAAPGQQSPADFSQIKTNLDNLKPTIKSANGGVDFDSTILAKALSGTGSAASMDPQAVKAMQAFIPALGTAEKNGPTTNTMKTAPNTSAQSQLKQQSSLTP